MRISTRVIVGSLAGVVLLALFRCGENTGPGPIAEVVISPPTLDLSPGASVRLEATVKKVPTGRTLDWPVTWSSSNPAVAKVDAEGWVTAIARGSAKIAASTRGYTDSARVVVRRPVSALSARPSSVTLGPGDAVRLVAEARAAGGERVPEAVIAWSSSDTTVATVDGAGLVSGRRNGQATVTAAVDAVVATAAIRVVTPFVLVGAGDIADCSSQGDEATAALLNEIQGEIFTLGDNVYPDGTAEEFRNCFHPSWGRHKHRIRPAVGNHEYHTANAAPYFAYFGHRAGEPGKGYYRYSLGDWQIIVLNSEIPKDAGSPQEQWLRATLAGSPARCTIAYWHVPRFASNRTSSNNSVKALWQALYEAGAEVILVGNSHFYERFAPQTPDGAANPERGIRQFVVGTGGKTLHDFVTVAPNSQVRYNGGYGVLKLRLFPEHYTWEFVPVAGTAFKDSGRGACH